MVPSADKLAVARRRGSQPGPQPVRRLGDREHDPSSASSNSGPSVSSLLEMLSDEARQTGAGELLIRSANLGVALLALLTLFPLMVIIAVAIKLDTPGPVFYRQLRIGLDRRGIFRIGEPGSENGKRAADLGGRPFVIYKFRTMWLGAEQNTGPVWATPVDDRTTRIGRFLRRYRLDEIPQFFNVLRGEMSVVGPRPERPRFVEHLRTQFTEYPLRQRVPPGITGWAQVHQEPDQNLDDVRVKLQYDLEYLRRRSLAFDLRIMLRTLPVMLEGERLDTESRAS